MKRITLIALLFTVTAFAGATPPVVTVRTAAELAAAAKLTAAGDVTIVVAGTIKTPPVYFPTTQATTRIIGEKTTSTIQFTGGFDGDWSKPYPAANGLEFNGRAAVLYGLTIKGYEGGGSAIKMHGSGALIVSRVTFADCAAVYRAPRVATPEIASQAHYNQVIGSHNAAAFVLVEGCTFRRCATSAWQWSHCIYVTAPNVAILDNTFDGCGNPLSIGNHAQPYSEVIVGNKFLNPTPSYDPRGVLRPAFFASLAMNDSITFTRNTLSGAWAFPWAGAPNPSLHFIDGNDYSGMTFTGHWAADVTKGVTFTIDQWKKMGFDNQSKWPATSP